jgi:SIR2-like domain
MLMVIFGAGASYDSAQAYRVRGGLTGSAANQNFSASTPSPDDGGPWRPPLAQDLFRDPNHAFGNIVTRYPKLNHVLTYLREILNSRSVEEELELLQNQSNGHPETRRELASVRFYLRDLLTEVTSRWIHQTNGVTNYHPLIREILRLSKGNDPVCLVTFNYDLLLEQALYTFGYTPRDPEEQFNSPAILKLFKPHGSVDWARIITRTETGVSVEQIIQQADAIQISDEFVRIGPNDISHRGRPIFPAIAIPVRTKTEGTFEWPQSHRTYFEQLLPHVKKILIIGWQAREAHFIKMLQSAPLRLTHLMVVGRDREDSQSILKYFAEETGQMPPYPHLGEGGFTHFTVNREGERFLAA